MFSSPNARSRYTPPQPGPIVDVCISTDRRDQQQFYASYLAVSLHSLHCKLRTSMMLYIVQSSAPHKRNNFIPMCVCVRALQKVHCKIGACVVCTKYRFHLHIYTLTTLTRRHECVWNQLRRAVCPLVVNVCVCLSVCCEHIPLRSRWRMHSLTATAQCTRRVRAAFTR